MPVLLVDQNCRGALIPQAFPPVRASSGAAIVSEQTRSTSVQPAWAGYLPHRNSVPAMYPSRHLMAHVLHMRIRHGATVMHSDALRNTVLWGSCVRCTVASELERVDAADAGEPLRAGGAAAHAVYAAGDVMRPGTARMRRRRENRSARGGGSVMRQPVVGDHVVRRAHARVSQPGHYRGQVGIVESVQPGDPTALYRQHQKTLARVRWLDVWGPGRDHHSNVDIATLVCADEAHLLRRHVPTAAMQRTLAQWIARVGTEDYHDPWAVFPARDNIDNAHRRTCDSLIAAGLLVPDRVDIATAERRYRPVAEAQVGV